MNPKQNHKAIYAAAAVPENSSLAFVGYLVVDGEERHRHILVYHSRKTIETDPARGEEFAVNLAREALCHAGKNHKEFQVFVYTHRQDYSDEQILKELCQLHKKIKTDKKN